MLDFMHLKHIGTDMYSLAGVIYLLVHFLLPGETPEANMQALFAAPQQVFSLSVFVKKKNKVETKSLYKLLGIRDVYYALDRLSMVMRKKGGMKLRGKAAQVKGVIEPLYHLWCKYMDNSKVVHRQVKAMLRANARVEAIMSWNSKDMYFSEADTKEFLQQVQIMSHLNQLLYQHFKRMRKTFLGQYFKSLPKCICSTMWQNMLLASIHDSAGATALKISWASPGRLHRIAAEEPQVYKQEAKPSNTGDLPTVSKVKCKRVLEKRSGSWASRILWKTSNYTLWEQDLALGLLPSRYLGFW